MYIYVEMELYKKIHTPQALIKDVSLTSRKVTGYLSSFDNQDSDGDAFIKGAYAKSISENGPGTRLERIAYLSQHRVSDLVGKFTHLEEKDHGLYFEGDIPDTTLGIDTLKLYEAKILKEHSVGVSIVHQNYEQGVNYITEAKLWEGSVVTWGANEETPFEGFKSLVSQEEVKQELEYFTKAIRNGTFTDKTFNLLEIGLEQLKSHLATLSEPSIDTPKPNMQSEDLIKHFTLKLFSN